MGNLTFKIEGTEKLLKKLASMQSGLDKAIPKSAIKQANMLQDAISSEAKRGATGNLKESVKVWQGAEVVELTKRGKGRVYYKAGRKNPMSVIVGMDKVVAFYAHMVEYGTSHSRAFPFFRRAIDGNAGKAADNLQSDMKKGIEGAI